MATVVLSNK